MAWVSRPPEVPLLFARFGYDKWHWPRVTQGTLPGEVILKRSCPGWYTEMLPEVFLDQMSQESPGLVLTEEAAGPARKGGNLCMIVVLWGKNTGEQSGGGERVDLCR